MAPEGVERKISDILSADVTGYSSLMEVDEYSTLCTMASYRETSIVKTTGGRRQIHLTTNVGH